MKPVRDRARRQVARELAPSNFHALAHQSEIRHKYICFAAAAAAAAALKGSGSCSHDGQGGKDKM